MPLLQITIISFLVFIVGCNNAREIPYQQFSGETMGTYYTMTFRAGPERVLQEDIEELLDALNAALSTYDPTSVVSNFNRNAHGIALDTVADPVLAHYFLENLRLAKSIHRTTDGYFEPTVMPLVNYWGFGYVDRVTRQTADTAKIEELLTFVGLDKVNISDQDSLKVFKDMASIELDFSALAKGYAVDQIATYLTQKKLVQHYFIDIGGENRAAGLSSSGKAWKIGIATPDTNASATSFDLIVHLQDKAIATSGNYRNFYQVNGQYIAHTINPKTGFFEQNTLLSASIIMDNCAEADGIATGCMAMGFARARALIEGTPNIEGILIYQEGSGMPKYFEATSSKVEYVNN